MFSSYMVVVKVGKPTERSKPGNRGKRDSQILLMHYLNRVHFDAPMSPLELEIFHQMRNVIGIDPTFYEYIFTVDADTVCLLFLGLMRRRLMDAVVGHTRVAESISLLSRRRFEYYWYLWRNETIQRGRLLVDDDPSLRVLHLTPPFEGVRISVWLGFLSARLFLALSYPHGGQGPPDHHLEPDH